MIPVVIEPQEDGFRATVFGPPRFIARVTTREEAIELLRAELLTYAARGQLVWLDYPTANAHTGEDRPL